MTPTPTADDLSQAALVQLFRHWERARQATDVEAYARRVVVNELRAMTRRRSWSERPQAEVADRPLAADPIAGADARLTLLPALAALGARERAVVVLRYLDDLPDAAIAEVVGCRESTVRSVARRALAKLHHRLTDQPTSTTEAHDG